jgi:putative transposase
LRNHGDTGMGNHGGVAGHPQGGAPTSASTGAPKRGYMIDNDNIHRRRSIRLPGYDYSQPGAYFITICTQNREYLFGNIVVGAGPRACPEPNDAGTMIQTVWYEIPIHYHGIEIDEFIVMPNHIHGIIVIRQAQGDGRPQGIAPTGGPLSLPDVVHRFKTMTTKCYAVGVKQHGWPPFPGRLWQRNYWEHIVRNEIELNRIREYIRYNPRHHIVRAGPRACPDLYGFGQPRGIEIGQPQGVAPTEKNYG